MVKLAMMTTSTEVHGDKVRLKSPLDDSCGIPLGRETVVHLNQKPCCSRSCTGVIIALFIILAIGGAVTGMYLKYHVYSRRQCIEWGPGCDMEPPKFVGHHGEYDVDHGGHSGKSGSDSGSRSGEGGRKNGDSDRKSGERWMKKGGGSDGSGESDIKNGDSGGQSGGRDSASHENIRVFPSGKSGDHFGRHNGRHLGRHKGRISPDWMSPRQEGLERHREYPPGPAKPQDDIDGHARPKHHLPLP